MMMRTFKYILLLPFLLIGLVAGAQSAKPTDGVSEKIKLVEGNLSSLIRLEGENPWTIQERMLHYKVHGVSIAVIHHYKIEWAKGYGWADAGQKIPVTDKTLFQAASISKSLNAVGVLKLAQDRRLNIDKDINQYLTTWKFLYDGIAKGKKITVKNLLSHTAGLNVHGFGGYKNGAPLPTVLQILNGSKPANSDAVRSAFEPGLRSEYSGGGTTISQQIVMDITHQPYDQYMYQNVLKPLGMTASTYTQPPVGVRPELLAAAYMADGKEVPGKYHVYPEQAAAGLWTNPTDLSKYIIETQLAYEGKSNRVLTQATTKLRLTPYLDRAAALGVFINDYSGIKYFQHGGANEGFRSQYYGSLDGGNGLVVMVNSDDGSIIEEIVNSIAKVYQFKGLNQAKVVKKIALNNAVLQSYTGKYQLTPTMVLTVSLDGNQLYGQTPNNPKFEISPETQTRFFVKTPFNAELEFIKNNKAQVDKLKWYQGGTIEAKKIK